MLGICYSRLAKRVDLVHQFPHLDRNLIGAEVSNHGAL
jgi:hypothetical protein